MNKQSETVELIKEYFKQNNLKASLECFELEVERNPIEPEREQMSELGKKLKAERAKTKQIAQQEKEIKKTTRTLKAVQTCAKQIFAIIINFLKQLNNIPAVEG